MPFAVDTQILIYALRKNPRTDDEKRLTMSAQNLLSTQRTVVLSSITWFEFLRGADEEERTELLKVQSSLDIRPIAAPVATKAAMIMSARNVSDKACRRCLNSEKTRVCASCGNMVSSHQRWNDALIVASAELSDDIFALYTNDDGILSMQEHVVVRLERLPNRTYGPLFDQPGSPGGQETS